MHLETVDAKPPPRDGLSPVSGSKRLRSVKPTIESISKELDTVSEASSARGNMCNALLLSSTIVMTAVAAAK
jgi:hypothetical protein